MERFLRRTLKWTLITSACGVSLLAFVLPRFGIDLASAPAAVEVPATAPRWEVLNKSPDNSTAIYVRDDQAVICSTANGLVGLGEIKVTPVAARKPVLGARISAQEFSGSVVITEHPMMTVYGLVRPELFQVAGDRLILDVYPETWNYARSTSFWLDGLDEITEIGGVPCG